MKRKGIVLSCFDYSAEMVKPWAEVGYECYCVDIRHKQGLSFDIPVTRTFKHGQGTYTLIGADILDWMPPLKDIAISFFFPPCTDVAVSGARWFKQKGLGSLIKALQLFNACIKIGEASGSPYMIENPVSTISTYWRKPDYIFQPWHYGDMYTKKTCLWTGNGFVMPEPKYIDMPDTVVPKIWSMPPSKERAEMRSITPPGFAKAVFKSNQIMMNTKEAGE